MWTTCNPSHMIYLLTLAPSQLSHPCERLISPLQGPSRGQQELLSQIPAKGEAASWPVLGAPQSTTCFIWTVVNLILGVNTWDAWAVEREWVEGLTIYRWLLHWWTRYDPAQMLTSGNRWMLSFRQGNVLSLQTLSRRLQSLKITDTSVSKQLSGQTLLTLKMEGS